MHHDVRQHQRRWHVVALAGQTHAIRNPECLCAPDEASRVMMAALV